MHFPFINLGEKTVRVFSVTHAPTPQYHQDDLFVQADVEAGNIVWKPKHERQRLQAVMEAAQR